MKDHYGCPVQATINVISGKWKVQILWFLSFGPLRYAELRKSLGRLTEKVLTDQLRQLEADRIVQREVSGSIPPAVTYSLSPEGQKLVPMMTSLCEWGTAHFGIVGKFPRGAMAANSR